MVIENLPWQDCLGKYDKKETLFYLDPPYYGCENDYGAGIFRRETFPELAARLQNLKGKYILTLNDVPETLEIFGQFKIERERIKYFISGKPQDTSQLIISNIRGSS